MNLIGELANLKNLQILEKDNIGSTVLPIGLSLYLKNFDANDEIYFLDNENSDSQRQALFNGILHFLLKSEYRAEYSMDELESFLRHENHRPVLDKSEFPHLEQIVYEMMVGIEKLYANLLLENLSDAASMLEVDHFLNQVLRKKKLALKILDMDETTVYFSLSRVEDDREIENQVSQFWTQVLNSTFINFTDNNGRRWVDKPWK